MSSLRGTFDPTEDYSMTVKEGMHVCQVVKAFFDISKTENDMLCLVLKIVGIGDQDMGITFKEWIVLNRRGFNRLKALVNAIDTNMLQAKNDPEGYDPWSSQSNHKYILGRVIQVNVKIEEKKGHTQVFKEVRCRGFYPCTPEQVDLHRQHWGSSEPSLGSDARLDFDGNRPRDVDPSGGDVHFANTLLRPPTPASQAPTGPVSPEPNYIPPSQQEFDDGFDDADIPF